MPANNSASFIGPVLPVSPAKPAAKFADSVKPVSTAKKPRNIKAAVSAPAKLATPAKPAAPAKAAAPAKPAPAAPAAAVETAAPAPRGLTRDAAGIVRFATNYETYSDRDDAYLAFFGNVARKTNNVATLRAIYESGVSRPGNKAKRYNPNYDGSAKATDVGVINRLCKAGYFTRSADGNTLTATKLALQSKAYNGSK